MLPEQPDFCDWSETKFVPDAYAECDPAQKASCQDLGASSLKQDSQVYTDLQLIDLLAAIPEDIRSRLGDLLVMGNQGLVPWPLVGDALLNAHMDLTQKLVGVESQDSLPCLTEDTFVEDPAFATPNLPEVLPKDLASPLYPINGLPSKQTQKKAKLVKLAPKICKLKASKQRPTEMLRNALRKALAGSHDALAAMRTRQIKIERLSKDQVISLLRVVLDNVVEIRAGAESTIIEEALMACFPNRDWGVYKVADVLNHRPGCAHLQPQWLRESGMWPPCQQSTLMDYIKNHPPTPKRNLA